MIPILYKADEKDFTTQGLGLLSDIQSVKVTEQRNAQYYLNMEMPVFSRLFKEIKLERLVKVDDHNDNDQLFRIKKIDTPSNGLCNVYAEHISRDIEGYTIEPDIGIRGSAQLALDLWRKYLVEKDKVTVSTDITTESKGARWLIDAMENPFYCLGGKEGSILQLYGGEYRFDNLNVKLLKTRGFNTGASITYGRNMNDMSQEESIEELANSIYPFAWKDKEDGNQEDREMIVLDPLYVDGPHIDKYAERRVVFVDFTDKAPKDKVVLKKLAEKYVKDNNVGAPKVSMTVSPVLNGQIAKGLELENFEQVNLCDIVTVKYHKLGIDVQAKVNEVTFDVLSQRFSEYKLGDEKRTLASSLGAIESNVNSIGKELQDLSGWAQQSADGKNTIFYGKDEPKAHKTGDTWFKENPDGSTTIHVWDGQTWKEVKTDYTEEFEQLDKELAEQKENIDKSLEQSEQAIKDSNLSIEKAEQAEKDAQKAIEDAGFVGKELGSIKESIDYQSNKITELDETTISNGKQIEEVGTGLKETITKTDENGKQITQINKDYNGLSTTVVDLKKDFDNLELPARNLVRDSLKDLCSDKYEIGKFNTVEKFNYTDTYRILIKAKNSNSGFDVYISTGELANRLGNAKKTETENVYMVDTNVKSKSSLENKIVLYSMDNKDSQSKEICVDWIAIYKNDTKTTDWYPALEDNAKSISEMWTEINQHSNEITMQAGNINQNKTNIAELEIKSESIKSTVSDIEDNIFNQNLINDDLSKNGYLTVSDIIGPPTVDEMTSDYIDIKGINEIFFTSYHLSNAEKATTWNVFRIYDKEKKTIDDRVTLLPNKKLEKDVVLEVGHDLTKYIKNKNAHFIRVSASWIKNGKWKLEYGRKKTGWTPYYDKGNNIRFSNIEQTANGIKQTVKNKADKSEVTQLAGQITSVVKDVEGNKSQITQNKELILQTVEDVDGRFVSTQQSIDGIQQTVKGKADQSQVTQLSGQIIQTVEDVKKNSEGVSENKTKITQNKNMINMKVSKGDVVGQLNIEAGKTLIDNKKVVIDAETVIIKGKSWMDGAVIKDASIGTAQIKNASITDAKIGSVDVGKLTSGTIKTGTINVESRMKVGENGSIESSYDYGDKYGETYNARWFEGTMNIGYRYWKNISNVYAVTSSNDRGAFKYHTQTFYGPDMIKLRQYPNKNNSTGEPKAHLDATAEAITMGKAWDTDINIGSDGNIFATGKIVGTRVEASVGEFNTGARIRTGYDGRGLDVGRIDALNNYQSLNFNRNRTDLADLELTKDVSGKRVTSNAIYDRTGSGGSFVRVNSYGTLSRDVSARKYKINEEKAENVILKAKKILDIEPKSWTYISDAQEVLGGQDKSDLISDILPTNNIINKLKTIDNDNMMVSNGIKNVTKVVGLSNMVKNMDNIKDYGYMADDFHDIGLTEVVTYDGNGEVDGLRYDKITMYLLEMIKDLYKKVEGGELDGH